MSDEIEYLVDKLIAGHVGGPLIDTVPDHLVPEDLPATYALQDRLVAKLGTIGGWKVMAGGQGEPLCSPIPATRYFQNGATLPARQHNRGGWGNQDSRISGFCA